MDRKRVAKTDRKPLTVAAYDATQPAEEAAICRRLRAEIDKALPTATSKVWHGAPVWFVGETPVVGYSVPAKGGVALLFWNGMAFDEPELQRVGKFEAAQAHFASAAELKPAALRRWLRKARTMLWDLDAFRRQRSAAIQRSRGRSSSKRSSK